jgi:hypothetical protein
MDTAPTGHTLLLLDATGAYHREVARQLEPSGAHYTTPMMHLQDPKQTKVLLATLAETTPVLEAANLQADLRRAGIEPWAWIINNSVAAARPRSPLLRQRAHNELREVTAVATIYARRSRMAFAYAFGNESNSYVNPALTLGVVIAGEGKFSAAVPCLFEWRQCLSSRTACASSSRKCLAARPVAWHLRGYRARMRHIISA